MANLHFRRTVVPAAEQQMIYRLRRTENLIVVDPPTVTLANTNFPAGSTVLMRSRLGALAPQPNAGAGPIPGYVNFIQNVNYANEPAMFWINGGSSYMIDLSPAGLGAIQLNLPPPSCN